MDPAKTLAVITFSVALARSGLAAGALGIGLIARQSGKPATSLPASCNYEPVDLSNYRASIESDGERLSDLAAQNLSANVPSCPNWRVADLVGHVASVFTMVSGVLESNDRPRRLPEPPKGDVASVYLDALRRLLRCFDATDPAVERWNWSVGPQVASFWWRRMAHEAAVHRWDAESALSTGRPIDPQLAADGIDEWFDVHLRSDITDPDIAGEAVGTIQIQCGDTPGDFWASLADRKLVFQRTVIGSDVAVRGPASDLLLLLWGRVPPETVEVIGETAVLRSWLAVPDI